MGSFFSGDTLKKQAVLRRRYFELKVPSLHGGGEIPKEALNKVFRRDATHLVNKGAAHAETAMYVVVHEDLISQTRYDSPTKNATKRARMDTYSALP
jgi:hypothetical protein